MSGYPPEYFLDPAGYAAKKKAEREERELLKEEAALASPTKDTIMERQEDPFFPTHSVFSMGNINENALMWLLMLKLSKTPQGMRIVEKFLTKLVDAMADGLDAYCRAGSANRISAWGSGRLLSLFMERFGFITQSQAGGFDIGLTLLTGAEIVEEFTTIIPWKAISPDVDFPSTVVLGSKSRTLRVERKPRVTSKDHELTLEE